MGAVYKAKRLSDEKLVAVKTLLPGTDTQPGTVERFLREAKLVMTLNHPNIIRGMDAGYNKGVFYYVMEYVEGVSLHDLIEKKSSMVWRDAVCVARQIAQGMVRAAELGIIHRDIKPSNIMIATDGTARLADLGVAKMVGLPGQATLTGTAAILGTPAYMSPEQVEGRELDPRSDMYALGLTLFTAINGKPPFETNHVIRTMTQRLTEDVPVSLLEGRGAPPPVRGIVKWMCARKRSERPGSWPELLQALIAVEQGKGLDKITSETTSNPAIGLLGRLALSKGFITPTQLERALQIQDKLLKCGVRKLLGQILVDEGFLKEAELKSLINLQNFYDRQSAEKQLADLIIINEIVPAETVREALAIQKDMFERRGFTLPIDQLLLNQGRINDQQRRAILRLQRRLAGRVKTTQVSVGVLECPQCVELVPVGAKECPSCRCAIEPGLGELRCPTCGGVQVRPGEHCELCGASMVGGKPMSKVGRRCPKCGFSCADKETRCPSCGAAFSSPLTQRVSEAVSSATKRARRIAAVLLVPIVLSVGAILLVWKHNDLRGLFVQVTEGESGQVRLAAERFLDAVQHQDFAEAIACMSQPPPAGEEGYRYAGRILQRMFRLPSPEYRLRSYSIDKVELAEDRATIYVTAFFSPLRTEGPGNPPMLEAKGTMAALHTTGGWRMVP
jgi:serine/threonine protein kinase